MTRRNRANPPAAGRKTALNGKTPCIQLVEPVCDSLGAVAQLLQGSVGGVALGDVLERGMVARERVLRFALGVARSVLDRFPIRIHAGPPPIAA